MVEEKNTLVGRFLSMIGALIWDPSEDRYLILKRSSEKDYAKDVWECGTGRVDQGESFTDAVRREMKEELGVDLNLEFIIGTTHFYRGDKIPQNEMLGVYYGCTLKEGEEIHLSWEHSEYRWVTLEEAKAMLSDHYWLVRLIKRAAEIRTLIPGRLIDFYRNNSLEF
jgi:8-oxo-dGTP diphosphatase